MYKKLKKKIKRHIKNENKRCKSIMEANKITYEFLKENINKGYEEQEEVQRIRRELVAAKQKEDYEENLQNIKKEINEKLDQWKEHIFDNRCIHFTFKSKFLGVKKDVEKYLWTKDGLNFPNDNVRLVMTHSSFNKEYPFEGEIYITF